MSFFQSFILGIIEGVTEFLPISSTGHLILATHFLRIPQTDFVKSFEIIIQLGAILGVVVLYAKTFLLNKEIVGRLAVACIPTFVLGAVFYGLVKKYLLGNTHVVVWSLLLGGIALVVFELFYKEKTEKTETLQHVSYKHSFIVGLVQSLAIIPGVSRSAATILGAMLLGYKRKTAVEFSFLLAVPIMVAASSLDVLKSYQNFSFDYLWLLLLGFVVSFITAIGAVKFLLKFIQKNNFIIFGVYRIIIAIILFLVI